MLLLGWSLAGGRIAVALGAEGGSPPPSRPSLEDGLRGRGPVLAAPGAAPPSADASSPRSPLEAAGAANRGGVPSATPPPADAPSAGAVDSTPGEVSPAASSLLAAANDTASVAISLDLVSDGDLAWWTGDRPRARRLYRDALRAAVAERRDAKARGVDPLPETRAAEARARLRTILLGNNFSPLVHQGRLFKALDLCPTTEPECVVTEAELALFLPPMLGGDPSIVGPMLSGLDTGPARARKVAAGGDPALLRADEGPPDAPPRPDLDGMGRGMLATSQRLPVNPGTSVWAFGLGGAPGLGMAASLVYSTPDAFGKAWRFDGTLAGDSRGGGIVSGALRGPRLGGGASVSRLVVDDWRSGGRESVRLEAARTFASGTVLRRGATGVEVGLDARTERDDPVGSWLRAAGPTVALTVGTSPRLRISAETGAGDYLHTLLGADVRGGVGVPGVGGSLVARAGVQGVPTAGTPWWRWPSAGGSSVLRGISAGRWRAPLLATGQIEWRRTVAGPLAGALFTDHAWADDGTRAGWHATAGAGLRLVVPGMEAASTRLDFGWGLSPDDRAAWGLVVGVGEAF